MENSEKKVLFVRVGWMRFYNGPVPGDERPVGGGSHNTDHIGHEAYNFRATRGNLYGYFQPPGAYQNINLARIDTSASSADQVSGVLLVMVARHPEGGQVIVGWYEGAEIYSGHIAQSPGKPKGYGHFCSAERSRSVLLPEYNRTFEVPKAKGGLGQANICYRLDKSGVPKSSEWMDEATNFVAAYRGENLLFVPEADADKESAEVVEKALARSLGQGFAKNQKERRALELRAMDAAKKHFGKQGYTVKDVSAMCPFDLLCHKAGLELHVEVKGTTTTGETVVLTRNEVRHAENEGNACVLYILHSIELVRGEAKGGKSVVINPWRIMTEHLRSISYTYKYQGNQHLSKPSPDK